MKLVSRVSALAALAESLTERGTIHWGFCNDCQKQVSHEVPGATEQFRLFIEKYAAGGSERKRRSEMYALRSGILHGSKLMQLDQQTYFGWDPPGWNQTELHRELWSLVRLAARNWLLDPT